MLIAIGTRLHINLYIKKTTSVPILVLLSQNAQSDEKVILSRCTNRIINILMTLVMMSLTLREHREHACDGDCHTMVYDRSNRGPN